MLTRETKRDYYMIDVVTEEGFRNAWYMAVRDFVAEFIVYLIFDRTLGWFTGCGRCRCLTWHKRT
jgi:hypothetical protein